MSEASSFIAYMYIAIVSVVVTIMMHLYLLNRFRYDATSYYSSTQILLDGLSCSSSNTTLSQCSLIGIGEHDCSHSQDVFITCLSSK